MSEYLVKEDLPPGGSGRGVYGYRRGDRIAADVVKQNGWEEHVVGADTKEAKQILADITGEPVPDAVDAAAPAKTAEKKG